MNDKKGFWWIIVLWIFLTAACYLPQYVWGGTHPYKVPLMYGVVEPDTVMVRIKEVGTGVQIGDDSIVSSFPDTLVYGSLDSQKVYEAQIFERWYGSGEYERPVSWIIPFRLIVASASLSDGDIAVIMDSLRTEHGDGSYLTGGAGSGSNDIRYYALDTSGTDEMIRGVGLTVRTIAGVFDAFQITNTSGYVDFTSPAGSLVVSGLKLGYVWTPDTANRSGNATDTIFGYNVAIDPAPSPNYCRVYGYATIGAGLKPAQMIVFTPKGDTAFNNCDTTFLVPDPIIVYTSTHADSIGYFQVDLLYSACVGDYTMMVTVGTKPKTITVPSQSTWRATW